MSRLAITLCVLGGGRIIEAMRTHGVAEATAYSIFEKVVEAINEHPAFEIKCDNSITALQNRAAGFNRMSYGGLLKFATAAIDGLAIQIHCPSSSEVTNQLRFFNGSKCFYCLNVQGVCDPDCRFLAVTCNHVGTTHDAISFSTSSLVELCAAQPVPYHWLGDAAYPLSVYLMNPFKGICKQSHPCLHAFNFYHSQSRITIERTFGIFVKRWGIFHRPLE